MNSIHPNADLNTSVNLETAFLYLRSAGNERIRMVNDDFQSSYTTALPLKLKVSCYQCERETRRF